jgi:hypothetical protein
MFSAPIFAPRNFGSTLGGNRLAVSYQIISLLNFLFVCCEALKVLLSLLIAAFALADECECLKK